MTQEITTLEGMLDRMGTAGDGRVSLGALIEAVGSRSFGPLLIVVGLIMVSPLSGIPGMPTTSGLLILLIAVQLLGRRNYFWLPRWLLRRSISRRKLCRALVWLRRPARLVDRWLRPRWCLLVRGGGTVVIALICIAIAVGMPLMELVPFSATGAGVALTAFGLALIAHDGLLAFLAFAMTATTVGLIVWKLL